MPPGELHPALVLSILFLLSSPSLGRELPFDDGTVADAPSGGFAVHAVDLDGDGDTDLLNGISDPDLFFRWLENTDGQGGTWAPHILMGSSNIKAAVAGDIDRDGDPDLVVADSGFSGSVLWMRNEGGASFPAAATIEGGFAGAHGLALGDIDGDGDLDVVGASNGPGSSEDVSFFENVAGDGSAWSNHLIDADFDGARAVVMADFDRDGDLDVAAAAEFADAVAYYRNNDGLGGAWTKIPVNTATFDQAVALIAADLDGDGRMDLAGAAQGSDDLRWWRNAAGNGSSWTEIVVDADYDAARGLAAADIDRDGDLDLLASAEAPGNDLAVYDNVLGNGTLFAPYSIEAGTTRREVALADLDHNGHLDAIANGPTQLECWRDLSINHRAFFPSGLVADDDAGGASGVAAGLIDGDGLPDFAATLATDDQVAFYRNIGGVFAKVTISFFDGASSVALGDVDSDGKIDVIATAEAGNRVAWFENSTGNGDSWKPFTADIALAGARAVATGDLDRDGDLDLVAAGFGANQIAWYRNMTGDGSIFSKATVNGAFMGASGVAIGDLDRDGDLDVVGAAATENAVTFFENAAGDGSSWVEHPVAAGFAGARAVRLADFDHDGDLDVLAAAETAGDVGWFANDGAGGGWAAHSIDTNLAGARAVDVGDFDLDGDLDVVAAAGSSDRLVWIENTAGDGSGWTTADLITGDLAAGAAAVAVADFFTDGRPDLLAAAATDDNFQLVRNGAGQFALIVADIAPTVLGNGIRAALFQLDFVHHGRAGAADLELKTLDLRIIETLGDPLTSAEANGIIENLMVYLDQPAGPQPGVFDPADVLVETIGTLSLSDGVQLVPFDDGDAAVALAQGATKTFFVVIDTTWTFDARPLASFQLLEVSAFGATAAEDAEHDTPLRRQSDFPISSTLITVFRNPLFMDGFESGNTAAWHHQVP